MLTNLDNTEMNYNLSYAYLYKVTYIMYIEDLVRSIRNWDLIINIFRRPMVKLGNLVPLVYNLVEFYTDFFYLPNCPHEGYL